LYVAAVVVAAAGNGTCNNSNYIEHSCAKQNIKKKTRKEQIIAKYWYLR